MRRLEIELTIISYINKNYDPIKPVTVETHLDEIGLDSLDRVELEQHVEDKFRVRVPDKVFWVTVKDVVDFVVMAQDRRFNACI